MSPIHDSDQTPPADLAATIARALTFWVATMALLAIASPLAVRVSAPWHMAAIGAATGIATWLLAWAFLRWQRMSLADAGLMPARGSAARFLAGVALGVAIATAHAALLASFAHVRFVAVTHVDAGAVAVACVGFLALAAREEIAFRGYLLPVLASRIGVAAALALTATLFAIEHAFGGASWANVVFGAIPGALVFGMAALASRGIAMPLGLHAAWNGVDWATGGKGADGLWRRVVEPGHASTAEALGLACYGLAMAAAFCLLWWIRRRAQRTGSRTHKAR